MSPVWNQPSRRARAVAASSRQYPPKTFGPRSAISPRLPGGTGTPSSSAIRSSTCGTGRPTDPILDRLCSRSRNVSPETVSVSPYASANQAPGKASRIRRTTGSGIFSPPPMISRTDERSWSASPGTCRTAFIIAGASHTTVACSAAIAASTAVASKDRSSTSRPPTCSVGSPGRSRPPTWYSGPQTSTVSSAVSPSSTISARSFQATLPCVMRTPLGREVVPEVYISRCSVSGAGSGTGGAGRPPPAATTRSNASHPAAATSPSSTRRRSRGSRGASSSTRVRNSSSVTRTAASACSRMNCHSSAASR